MFSRVSLIILRMKYGQSKLLKTPRFRYPSKLVDSKTVHWRVRRLDEGEVHLLQAPHFEVVLVERLVVQFGLQLRSQICSLLLSKFLSLSLLNSSEKYPGAVV